MEGKSDSVEPVCRSSSRGKVQPTYKTSDLKFCIVIFLYKSMYICVTPTEFGSNFFFKHKFALINHNIFMKTNSIICNFDFKTSYRDKSHCLTIAAHLYVKKTSNGS